MQTIVTFVYFPAAFGSFGAVLEASESELRSVPGVGENSAALLRLIPAVSRRSLIGKTPEEEPIRTPSDAGRFFIPRFMYEREEAVLALLLDARSRPIACKELSRGVVNAVEINARKLVEMAMERRCSSVILAHNHLSGVALPSREDEQSTRKLRQALALVDVDLQDHIVVAGVEYVSLKESGLI